jgi:heme-degrading monooxygenase HmoA
MFARVSTYHGSPGKVKEGTRLIQEITPEMQRMQGFQKAYLLVDGKSGKAISISMWGNEEDANRSTSTTGPIRDRISQSLGASGKPVVEIFEVGTEITHRTAGGKFARVSEYRGSPSKIDDGIQAAKGSESALKQMQGFHQVFLFADRKTGRCMTMSFWDSEDTLNRSLSGVNPIREGIARSLGSTEKPTFEVYELAGDIPQRARKAA